MKIILALLLLCVASPALAQSPVPTWIVDRKKSTIEFKSFKDGKPYTAAFQSWTADIAFDPANLRATKATVTIDVRSATTGEKTFTEYITLPRWYNPQRTPYAMFQIQSMTHQRDNLYNANGTLFVYNKPKTIMLPIPGVSLPVYATVKGDTAEFKSNFTFAIPDFSAEGMKKSAVRKINLNMVLNTRRAGQSGK